MHKHIARMGVSAVAAVALSGLGVTGAGASGPAAKAAGPALVQSAKTAHASATPGAQLWASRYSGSVNGQDEPFSMAVSPDGATVYVTGISTGASSGLDYATVAYSAGTGAQLWVKRYNGPANSGDSALSVAVSPNGRKVVVTGASSGINYPDSSKGADYATIAYNAATGAQLWVKRYNGPAKDYDSARSVTVGPSSAVVYVTGISTGTTTGSDYATIAYNAGTGAKLWVSRYNGQANSEDDTYSVAVSPDGQTVYVTGGSANIPPTNTGIYRDYATVAYSSTTSVPLWTSLYNGPANGDDFAITMAVSPATGTVYVTGQSDGTNTGPDYATVAYQG